MKHKKLNNCLCVIPKINIKNMPRFSIDRLFNNLPKDITKLCLSHRNLTYIPDSISRFKNLEVLDCSNNSLKSLPNISVLTSLRYLNCSYNLLKTLPNLSTLVHLQVLYCSSNKLSSLPNLSGLKKLENIDCNNNQLTSLPSLSGLKKLKLLCTMNNKLPKIMNIDTHYLTITEQYLKNIDILIKCKYRIMCFKYRKYFRRWLWERIRLPKINKEYHPDKLHDAVDSFGNSLSIEDIHKEIGW